LVYINSESADIFAFVNDLLTELIFYDIPGPRVCIGDFAAGLRAAMADFNVKEKAAAEEEGRTY